MTLGTTAAAPAAGVCARLGCARSCAALCSGLMCVRQADDQDGWDFDLSNHVLSFILVALSSPEASANAAVRKRFVERVLDCGEHPRTLPRGLRN